jgi:biopolymer transport protein TolQ
VKRGLVLLSLFLLGGCATRGDVRRLEDAVLLMRAESIRRDSANVAELRSLATLARTTTDALAAIRAQVAQIKGDLSGELYAIAQQLVQVQELTGQSQQRLTELRTQLEALKMILAKDVNAERDAAAQYIPWLATIGAVGPLLGLLGTVLGVMSAFLGIAAGGSGNLAAVAPGVAEALITTVAGLVAAIPAVMGYNYFATRLGGFEGEMDGFANELIGTMAREGLL